LVYFTIAFIPGENFTPISTSFSWKKSLSGQANLKSWARAKIKPPAIHTPEIKAILEVNKFNIILILSDKEILGVVPIND